MRSGLLSLPHVAFSTILHHPRLAGDACYMRMAQLLFQIDWLAMHDSIPAFKCTFISLSFDWSVLAGLLEGLVSACWAL